MGLMICKNCGGSLTTIGNGKTKTYRCMRCGNATTEVPENSRPQVHRDYRENSLDKARRLKEEGK